MANLRLSSFALVSSLLLSLGCSSSDPEDSPAPNTDSQVDAGTDGDSEVEDDASTDDPDGSTSDPDGSTEDPDASLPKEAKVLTEGYVPRDIAVGGGFVYFTETNYVRRLPVNGGDAVQLHQTQAANIGTRSIAADSNRFAWTEFQAGNSVVGDVFGCEHSGCNDSPKNFFADQSTQRIDLAGDVTAWTSLSKKSVQGLTGNLNWQAQFTDGELVDIAAAGHDVFWASAEFVASVGKNGIHGCNVSAGSCAASLLNDQVGKPFAISAAGDNVLVLGDAGVFRMDLDGQNSTKIADSVGVANKSHIVTDGTMAYWAINAKLFACEISSCTATEILEVSGQESRALALDDEAVYWATAEMLEGAGAIRRIDR